MRGRIWNPPLRELECLQLAGKINGADGASRAPPPTNYPKEGRKNKIYSEALRASNARPYTYLKGFFGMSRRGICPSFCIFMPEIILSFAKKKKDLILLTEKRKCGLTFKD